MLSQSVQDYLKKIFKLQSKGPVSTTELARELDISGASVTG
jgi:Mn-dependent DtxR family transcriptional regulator